MHARPAAWSDAASRTPALRSPFAGRSSPAGDPLVPTEDAFGLAIDLGDDVGRWGAVLGVELIEELQELDPREALAGCFLQERRDAPLSRDPAYGGGGLGVEGGGDTLYSCCVLEILLLDNGAARQVPAAEGERWVRKPAGVVGEASSAPAKALGLDPDPKTGGASSGSRPRSSRNTGVPKKEPRGGRRDRQLLGRTHRG